MKIGVITDIHSNIVALEAVFNEFQKLKVDKIICLGDIVGIGSHPHECAKFLLERKDMFISWILGNHEGYLINGIPKTHHNIPDGKPTEQVEFDCYQWNHSQLTKEEREFLISLNKTDELEIEGIKIVIEHYPYDDNLMFKDYIESPTFDQARELFRNKDADIYLYGHTHVRCINEKDGVMYINPGSLGCPLDTDKASAGLIEIENGKYTYKNVDCDYDVDSVAKEIREINYPLSDFMVRRFYGRGTKIKKE